MIEQPGPMATPSSMITSTLQSIVTSSLMNTLSPTHRCRLFSRKPAQMRAAPMLAHTLRRSARRTWVGTMRDAVKALMRSRAPVVPEPSGQSVAEAIASRPSRRAHSSAVQDESHGNRRHREGSREHACVRAQGSPAPASWSSRWGRLPSEHRTLTRIRGRRSITRDRTNAWPSMATPASAQDGEDASSHTIVCDAVLKTERVPEASSAVAEVPARLRDPLRLGHTSASAPLRARGRGRSDPGHGGGERRARPR